MIDQRSLRATPDNPAALLMGGWEVRAKTINNKVHGTFLHVRSKTKEGLHVHMLLDEDGALMAMTTGKNDSDAWRRLCGDMHRRDMDID